MSSIDKYVREEARECNPRVRVSTEGGRIVGRLDGQVVFDIADRYGYLSESERSIIRSSIDAHEAQKKEQERLAAIRAENERVQALADLRREVGMVRSAISQSYQNAKKQHSRVVGEMKLSSKLAQIKGYNLSGYEARIRALEEKARDSVDEIDRDYHALMDELARFENGIRDDASTAVCIDKKNRVRNIRTVITGATLPVEEINQLEQELDQLAKVLGTVQDIELQLKGVPAGGLVGSIAQSALKEIRTHEISSLEDVDRLLHNLQEKVLEINSAAFQDQTKETTEQIALLDGVLRTCAQMRAYIVQQDYAAGSFRKAIEESAAIVFSIYNKLRTAEYTTCRKERMTQVLDKLQEILIGTASDEQTLRLLHTYINEGRIYERDDLLLANDYAEYQRKVTELTDRGYPLKKIPPFDPFNCKEQSGELIELLIEQEVTEGVSATRMTYILACQAMEDMGYRMLRYDIGNGGEESDALANEAIYVIPGCEGVAWQLIVSGCDIIRRIVPIGRASGGLTSVERVREVAKMIEESGEIEEFYSRYAELSGGELEVLGSVETTTEECDDIIVANGYLELSEEGERIYDQIMSKASKTESERWATAIPRNSRITTVVKKAENERARVAVQHHQTIQAQARRKTHAN